MLVFDTLRVFTTLHSGTTVTFRANLFVEGFCTDFDHDGSQDSFEGQVTLVAVHMIERIADTSTTETTGSPFTIPMTVVKSSFDTIASTGACIVVGTLGLVPGVPIAIGPGTTVTFQPLTGISGELALSPMSAGFSVLFGSIGGTMSFGPAGQTHFTREANEHPFSLTFGCPL